MALEPIGLLHPGEMGAGVGAVLVEAGHAVTWASSGRGPASVRRAASAGLVDVGSVGAMIDDCALILSICPPAHALEVALQVAGFSGLYVDANAIAPATARRVAEVIEAGGGRYVDGGIIGGPPTPTEGTHLYLSGPSAREVSEVFAQTTVDTRVVSEDQTAASAIKMCFAAWTKGTTALLLDIRALAIAEGVEGPLLHEWHDSIPKLASRSLTAARQAATKGWRWVGEMEEIAATFRSARLPDGFHLAAAEIYRRPDRDEHAAADPATLESVLEALNAREP
jgi:3-hydroxyisobutyrate dehydrogenase-like beta-hydroxyacid dehydrogenase